MVLPIGPWGGGAATFYQITNSLLFRGGQHLSRTPSVSGNTTKWSVRMLIRRAKLDSGANFQTLFNVEPAAWTAVYFYQDALTVQINDGGAVRSIVTSRLFRDINGWYDILITFDRASATAAHKLRLYVNGIEETSFSTDTRSSISGTCNPGVCDTTAHVFGKYTGGASRYFEGQIAEPIIIDGQSLTPTSFGEFDSVTLNWRPKSLGDITWGTNGVYLGKPWNAASLGTDYSGQGNNWTPFNFTASDVLSDSPTNVYAMINTLATWNGKSSGQPTISNGNLSFSGSGSWWGEMYSTHPVSSGKWYWEVPYTTAPGSASMGVGVRTVGSISTTTDAGTANNAWFYRQDGQQSKNGVISALGGTITNGSVMGLAFDADAGTLAVYKDNVLQGTITGIPAGTYATLAHSYNAVGSYKFGQSGFTYTEPSGFKAISTANLPATIGATSGTFTGNANSDGPFIYTGAVPATLTINGNAVTWGTHADKLATGFKLRTSSSSYNSTSTNNWVATYSTPQKPTVGANKVPSNAQGNP